MARQLVFTSAPQGLMPGRTGYSTVARHRDLRDRLAVAIESLSVYPDDWQPAPIICAFRLVDVGGTRFPVLSRMVHAGQDYTHRGHFLAHHLALDPEEITGAPPPAEIFRRWTGWRNLWDGPPRWFDEKDWVDLTALRAATPPALPAETWARLTGDAGRAALLVEGLSPVNRVLRCPVESEGEILSLLSECSALLPPAECWRTEFTTCLQFSDSISAFRWAVVRAGTLSDSIVSRTSGVIDLTLPDSLPPAPENALSRRARGTSVAAPAPTAPAPRPVVVPSSNILTGRGKPEPLAPANPRAAQLKKPITPRIPTWIFGAIVGVLAAGLALAIIFWPHASAPNVVSAAPPAPPPTVFIVPKSGGTPAEAANSTTAGTEREKILPPAAGQAISMVSNTQALADIRQLANTSGKALEALARWKELSVAAPDFTTTHLDVLRSRILPNARKEWVAKLDQITADLSAGKTKHADLVAQLATLRSFPQDWPVAKPDDLERAANSTAAILTFVDKLPDAPVWVVDNLTSEGISSDYRIGSVTLAIPELNTLLASNSGKFHIAAAPATSLEPPPADQWFNFNILPVDFEPGKFLILQDASRGDAGGRLMLFTVDKPGQVKLTWRMFQANSSFFKRFPANAPLRPMSRELWLHFAGEPPLPSFYLLLQRQGDVSEQNWKPLTLPLAWLNLQGAPAVVDMPPWLANNLVMHASAGQSFHLEPMNLNSVAQSVTVTPAPANTASGAEYQAAMLVGQLEDKYRALQTDLERAQQQLVKLQAITDPNRQPPKAMMDQANQAVKKIQSDLNQLHNSAVAAGKPKWALSVSPWLLYCNPAGSEPLALLQFTPNETGPTP